MKKHTFKQALRTWHQKGYNDAVFGIKRMDAPNATQAEREAYGEGYLLGLEEVERKLKAEELKS